jgi:signal transduction histidine kinase
MMAGGIIHNFNNLLVGILGNADLLLREISPESIARDSLEEIRKASLRASDLTSKMLAYSGKGQFVIESVDVNSLIENMTPQLKAATPENVNLRLDLSPAAGRINADIARISQVITNLVTNAFEAIGSDGGGITIRTESVYADQAGLPRTYIGDDLPAGHYTVLEVLDDGCGMDAETQEKLFDPFFSTKFTGRGLGMPAVLGIVRGHRGAVTVTSQPGQGTTVRILLPHAD